MSIDNWSFCNFKDDNDAWLYCDASSYFQAFVNACLRAESQIFIAGWDFHSETQLVPQLRKGLRKKRWVLKNFLSDLLKKKPQLQIYILTWDYAPFYILEREVFQSLRIGWLSQPRIYFHLDADHPFSSAHHQKFVVIDENLAFIGGLDLTIRRWDDTAHRSIQVHRKDPSGGGYDPFHDYQMGLSGPIAQDLSALFRKRWLAATGKNLTALRQPDRKQSNPLPAETVSAFSQARIALSLTRPPFREDEGCTDILTLHRTLIQAAEKFIIIENQYLTARSIVEMLMEAAAKEKGPEIIIILPELAGGWLEKRTMGALQTMALQQLTQNDPFGRITVVYPYDSKRHLLRKSMTVHSKIILVDQNFLSIGSANLNNRSMGFDTECQITIDARGNRQHTQQMLDTAAFVLSHHTRLSPRFFFAAYREHDSFRRALEEARRQSPKRNLATFAIPPPSGEKMEDYDWVDMEKPSAAELAMDSWGRMTEVVSGRLRISPRVLILLITVALGLGIAVIWKFTPVGEFFRQDSIRDFFGNLEEGHWETLLFVAAVFAIGSLVFVPINLLIIASAGIFPMAWAFLYIFVGIMANVAVGYVLGTLSGKYFFKQFFGEKTKKILQRIGKGHFSALLLVRIFPVAPSSLINIAAGAGHIPYWRFLAATLLGMAPGTTMLVLFQKSLIEVFKEQSAESILTLVFLTFVTVGVFYWSRRRFSRYQKRD